MKAVFLSVGACGVAFVLAGVQLGLFDGAAPRPVDEQVAVEEIKKPAVRAKFPQDLAPAARAQPVPQAAAYDFSADTVFKVAFLKTTGALHPWQEYIKEEWQAERVEETQLAVVLGAQKKSFIDIFNYPNGAPPVSRYRYELEASVIEAKTGKVLGNRMFVNMPRGIKPVESWELTTIGQPVSHHTVFNWIASNAKAGFPPYASTEPLVTVVD